MSVDPDYFGIHPSIAMRREEGVLEVVFHRDGGPLIFDARFHRDLGHALAAVGADPDNRVVILTGAGGRFIADFDYASFVALADELGPYEYNARMVSEGRRMTDALLAIEAPVIAAVNGPALAHSELAVLADVVLAADTAVFQDVPHFPSGVVPGDGIQLVWMKLLGPNRGRYFLLTGQRLSAGEARDLGVVGEVLAPDELMPRARALAREWAARPMHLLRGTRQVLNAEWRQLIAREYAAGFAQETISLMSAPLPADAPAHVDLLALTG